MSDNSGSKVIQADTKQLDAALNGKRPALVWLSAGQTPAIDLRKALDKAADDYKNRLDVLIVDTNANPAVKERFEVDRHPVLVGWYNGEVVKRRLRPWATDVTGLAETLAALLPVIKNEETASAANGKEKSLNNTPVHVTDATFEKEVLRSDLPVLVDFWAEWCGPCRMVAPILEKLAKEYAGKVKIAKVDVDRNPGLSNAFQIMSIPTLMFVKNGKIVGQAAGAAPEPALRDALKQLIELKVPA
jgi:thioredoxin 1